jgi:predicted ATPase|tara:strand:+ start:2995 stop:3708 length:714 start_codon:yes stop_codon:yes gene_type:complete
MAAEIIIAHGIWRLSSTLASLVPVQISVIGATGTGKTTLDRQLTTRGEVRMFSDAERTHHRKNWLGNYKPPEATKKRVKSEGLARTVVSRDLGGHDEYRTLWLADMINRDSKNVFVVIDHRHILDRNNVDNQAALSFFVEALKKKRRPRGLTFRGWLRWKSWYPRRVIVIANKADEWMSDEDHETWKKGFIARHGIFDVFRQDLFRLQEMDIPVYMDAMSARYSWNVQDALYKGLTI